MRLKGGFKLTCPTCFFSSSVLGSRSGLSKPLSPILVNKEKVINKLYVFREVVNELVIHLCSKISHLLKMWIIISIAIVTIWIFSISSNQESILVDQVKWLTRSGTWQSWRKQWLCKRWPYCCYTQNWRRTKNNIIIYKEHVDCGREPFRQVARRIVNASIKGRSVQHQVPGHTKISILSSHHALTQKTHTFAIFRCNRNQTARSIL